MAPAIEPKGSVRALGKAMELLGLLLDHRGPMTLQELQKRSGYPKSTVHGLLSTLREYDMIGQNPDGTYCLGIRLYEYGCAVAGAWDITALAHPYLEKLAAQTGGGAFLSLRSERHAISFDKAVSAAGSGLQVWVETGTPLPLHATAQGKLLLSGDTLFAGTCGRTDFPGGDVEAMRRSLKRLAVLPDDTQVLPGHDSFSTMAAEKTWISRL